MTETREPVKVNDCSFCFGPVRPLRGGGQRRYLVDLAGEPKTLRLLYQWEDAPDFRLVYLQTRYQDLARSGPVLIDPVEPDAWQWLEQWVREERALALDSEAVPMEVLLSHFQGLVKIRSEDHTGLFRFADPRILANLGESLSHPQCAQLLGPLTRIHGCQAGREWQIARRDKCHQEAPSAAPFTLTQANLSRLVQVREQQIAHSIAQSISQSQDLSTTQVSTWLRQLKGAGAPDEQALIEACFELIQQGQTSPLKPEQLAHLRKKQGWQLPRNTREADHATARGQSRGAYSSTSE